MGMSPLGWFIWQIRQAFFQDGKDGLQHPFRPRHNIGIDQTEDEKFIF